MCKVTHYLLFELVDNSGWILDEAYGAKCTTQISVKGCFLQHPLVIYVYICRCLSSYLLISIYLLSLFCHSPVFPVINAFYKQGILSDTAFYDNILTISAPS